jgi:hypothetical protein
MTLFRKFTMAAVGTATLVASVAAQDAQRVPAGGPGTLVGIVTDPDSRPLDDVEITVGDIDRTVRSARDGSFRFERIPAGKHDIRARRLGYEMQRRTVTVGTEGGAVVFILRPIPQRLPTVVTSTSRGGLRGVVADSQWRPLPGASVRVFGGSARTVTDSAGEFFLQVRRGEYMVHVVSPGHKAKLLSVTIPPDSGRYIAIALVAGPRSSARQEIAMREFAHRLAWRGFASVFLPRERLEAMGDRKLLTIVRAANMYPLDESQCTATVNGGPETAPLWLYDADDLEAVEVYPRTGRNRRTGETLCPVVYVWLR